jgi:tetratricopeptide (TPR) repeat protein
VTEQGQGATARIASDLLSPDLLNGLGGIEQGLRRRRNLGRAGGIGLVGLATIQIGLVVSNMVTSVSWSAVMGQWYVFVASTIVAATLVLFVATRYWIKESRTAFRYTCRIVEFDAVGSAPAGALPSLRHDLSELLNDRIGRLSFLNQEPDGPEQEEAHLHIAGEYLVREEGEGENRLLIELTPRLRVGGPSASETLAHRVSYPLPERKEGQAPDELGLKREDIGKILELVYFSVATCLYKQIQNDVERKIALLPTRYLRATAYLYEAEDYSQSNTLDAYDDAQALFEKARFLYDPSARVLPRARLRRLSVRLRRPVRWLLDFVKRMLSHVIPRLAKREAMLARTEVGLANTLVARRALARLSGRRVNQIFAARAIAEKARGRLTRLVGIGYPGADDALFDARVTLALVLHYLGSDERAEAFLKRARASLPDRAEENPRYLFVAALVEPRTTSALSLLRRAVELSPRFEIAQFERARRAETLWQFRPDLERTVAETVLNEYRNVVRINPGNIQAWSSLGHTHWLLAEDGDESALKQVRDVFNRGVAYKDIKRETFVAGLRYSLARVAAERGEFAEAYGHYVASTTASVGEGIAHGSWAEQHNSVVRNEAVLGRFARYVASVERQLQDAEQNNPAERRILCSVRAFVENDYGEAYMNFFERTGKEKYLKQAFLQFEKALKTNETYVMPAYNLSLLNYLIGDLDSARQHIRSVLKRESKWPEALLEEMMVEAWLSHGPAENWGELEDKIRQIETEITALERRMKTVQENDLTGDRDEGTPRFLRSGLGADATEVVAAGSAVEELKAEMKEATEELEQGKQKRTEVEGVLDAVAKKALKTVHGLVPHDWLWTGSDFRWEKVPKARTSGRRRKSDERWVQDFGDLHARALEAWAHTRALSRVDETERKRGSRGIRRTDRLLRHLEACFWPDRQEGLAARLLLGADPSLEDRLGSLAARSLAFDPANYRLLLTADMYLPGDGGGAKKKLKAFVDAMGQRGVAPPVRVWLGDRLEKLEAYDCALDAYGGAAIARSAGVDKATVLLGMARAQWGVCRYKEAIDSLALVPRKHGTETWRTAFVKELVRRGQVQNGSQPAPIRAVVSAPQANGGRLVTLTGIAALRRARDERTRNKTEEHSPQPPELAARESDGCQGLVGWLEAEHGASIEAEDVAGATDAAQALLLLTSARSAGMAPNRTTPLPDVSASTGDEETDRQSSAVPLIRRLAIEAHPDVLFDHEDRLRELVRRQLPELQKRIEETTGVSVPLPSISWNDYLAEREFRVLANELQVRSGVIPDDGSYEPIVTATREAIEQELRALVGVDEVVKALRKMTDEEGLAARVLADDTATIQLLVTVRRLIKRRIRVDFEELLRDLAQDAANVDAIVDSIRARRRFSTEYETAEQPKASLQGPSWAVSR